MDVVLVKVEVQTCACRRPANGGVTVTGAYRILAFSFYLVPLLNVLQNRGLRKTGEELTGVARVFVLLTVLFDTLAAKKQLHAELLDRRKFGH